jgi:hypothetical protein
MRVFLRSFLILAILCACWCPAWGSGKAAHPCCHGKDAGQQQSCPHASTAAPALPSFVAPSIVPIMKPVGAPLVAFAWRPLVSDYYSSPPLRLSIQLRI